MQRKNLHNCVVNPTFSFKQKFLNKNTFLILFILSNLSFPQWSTDPNNNLIIGYGLDPHICSDSAGGCYITYNYETLSYPQKLALERIDKFGYKPWGDKKQILGGLPEQWQAEIIGDGEGGVIIGYEDNEWMPPYYFNSKVMGQRVDSSGNFLWGQTGVRVTTEETNHGLGTLVSDGDGGCVIVWQDYDEHISMNRINNLGERVWGDSGIVLASTGTNSSTVRASDGGYYVQINTNLFRIRLNGEIIWQDSATTLGYPLPDPEGGIVLSGSANWSINGYTLIAQRKDSLGNNLWQEPYVEIADSLDINTLLNINYNNGYYYYSWTGKKNGIDKIAQFQALRLDGTKLFSEGSLPLSNYPIDALLGGILSSDSGSVVLIWEDFRPDAGVFAQKVDTSGKKLWDTTDVRLYSGAYADLFTTTDGNGGAIGLGWHQYDFSIRVFNVSKNGIMGEVVVPVELISFTANMINDKVELNWQTATELNNQVFQIERRKTQDERCEEWQNIGLVSGNGTTTEIHQYSFTDNNVTAGKYDYRLKQIDFDGTYNYSPVIEVEVNPGFKKYDLFQNYPNPFNSSTMIKYQIPQEGRVRINLYNILGEKILTLFEGEREKGIYSFAFSSNELPSGNYFYSLESNSSRLVKKLTIIK